MITGIRLNGRGLIDETNLTFFTKTNQRISVVFGRNGAGKTTIGDGFARYSVEQQVEETENADNDLTSTLLIHGTREDSVPPQVELSTLVFNEQFIENNVRISDDGIRALVLFGKSGNTQDDLDTAIEAARISRESFAGQVAVVDDAKKVCETNRDLAFTTLRRGWADRERMIRGNKNNSRVNQQTLDNFLSRPVPKKDLETLRTELDEAKDRLTRSKGGEEIPEPVSTGIVDVLLSKFDTDIFQRTIEAPTGEGLAGLVSAALETHGSLVATATTIFDTPELTHCPLCLQSVSEEHRNELLEAIKNSVDRAATEFTHELDSSFLRPLVIQLDNRLVDLDPTNAELVKHLTDNLNTEIKRWNASIAAKKTSLYAPVAADFESVGTLVRDLQQALKTFEQTRLDWNDGIKGIRQLLNQTLDLNNDVSRLEIEARLENYRSALNSLQKAETTLAARSEALDKLDMQVRDLKSAMRNEDIAADDVNRGLATVFADPNRLRIVVADESQSGGRFMLQSRGRYLKPHRLSVGERNVLSLCYFFTLLRQCLNDGLDLNKTLIVLDDPISSVDIDCRIGILSYLESQLKELLTGSSSAKTLFLTHDVGIFQDLGKTSKAVLDSLEPPSQGTWDTAPWVLRNVGAEENIRVSLVKHLGGFDEPLHEYKTLLGYVFQYAVDGASPQENDVASVGIGNALRRVYEAFGVFIYGQKSITSMRIVEAYESLGRGPLGQPIRHALITVLHGGSHNKDRMMMLRDFGMGASVDPEERVIVVRRILALMHAVQPIHMRHYLSDEATTILEEWVASYLSVPDGQSIRVQK
ncbi:AAA family ATPase [Glutamicibacter arilaitensis]